MIPAIIKLINKLGLQVNPATEDKQDAIIAALGGAAEIVLIDDVSTTNKTYIGKAPISTATSASAWQIQRLDQTGTPVTLVVKWAGTGIFDQVWDNRTSLTYN